MRLGVDGDVCSRWNNSFRLHVKHEGAQTTSANAKLKLNIFLDPAVSLDHRVSVNLIKVSNVIMRIFDLYKVLNMLIFRNPGWKNAAREIEVHLW